MRLAIIGAGIGGLAAAHRLRERRPGLDIVIFEQTRGPGGRAATRRLHGAAFDYGAQYFKTPTPELHHFVAETLPHATLVDIGRPVWVFDADGRIVAGDPEQNADPKWTYGDGLARLAAELAAGLDIRYEVYVDHLAHDEQGYVLFDAAGHALDRAEAVLLTPPAPQTSEILSRSDLPAGRRDALLAELGRASYRPCLSVTLGYAHPPREQPYYALVNTDRRHPISWLAYEHLKPGRDMAGQGVLIAQMAPGWSHEHWNDAPDQIEQSTAELVSKLLQEELPGPAWSDLERWQYALPDGGCDSERLHTGDGLFFAGDYLSGQGRIHLALQSGWDAASRIADWEVSSSATLPP
jgi:predicted NAD/FAD-dependent oxidoreductase